MWGPPPSDPSQRTVWEHGLWLLSELPDLLARLVIDEGSTRPTLVDTFGLEALAELEASVAEQFLCRRQGENMREVVITVLAQPPWVGSASELPAATRTRVADRLAEDIVLNIMSVILRHPPLRGWLGADW